MSVTPQNISVGIDQSAVEKGLRDLERRVRQTLRGEKLNELSGQWEIDAGTGKAVRRPQPPALSAAPPTAAELARIPPPPPRPAEMQPGRWAQLQPQLAPVAQQLGGMVGGPAGQAIAGGLGAILNPSALALGGSIAAIATMQHFATAARDVRVESQRLGVGVEYFQSVGRAARSVGADVESLTAVLERFRISREEALSGNVEKMAEFRAAGFQDEKDLRRGGMEGFYNRALSGTEFSPALARQLGSRGAPALAGAFGEVGKSSLLTTTTAEMQALERFRIGLGQVGDALTKGFGGLAKDIEVVMEKAAHPLTSIADIEEKMERQAKSREAVRQFIQRETEREIRGADLQEAARSGLESPQEKYDREMRQIKQFPDRNLRERASLSAEESLRQAGLGGFALPHQEFMDKGAATMERDEALKLPDRQRAGEHIVLREDRLGQISGTLSPGKQFQETLGLIGEKMRLAESSPADQQMLRRQALMAQQQYVAAGMGSGLAQTADIRSGAYSEVIGATYRSRDVAALTVESNTWLAKIFGAVVAKQIAGEKGFQSQMVDVP